MMNHNLSGNSQLHYINLYPTIGICNNSNRVTFYHPGLFDTYTGFAGWGQYKSSSNQLLTIKQHTYYGDDDTTDMDDYTYDVTYMGQYILYPYINCQNSISDYGYDTGFVCKSDFTTSGYSSGNTWNYIVFV